MSDTHGEFSGYAEALWPCPTIRALTAQDAYNYGDPND